MDDLIRDYFAAWSGKDAEAVAAFVTDDVEFEDVGAGHRSSGRDQFRTFVEICYERVPQARYEVVDSRLVEDTYWVEWVMQPMGLRGASVGTVRDGRIAANRDYWAKPRSSPATL
jgi:uncharacterized protein (TIGR02246 family)